MIKKILLSIIFLVLSVVIASVWSVKLDSTFINTIYTISGIMFSIGMGVICTFSPDKIKNIQLFSRVKENIITVRNSFLFYFALVSFFYLLYLLCSNFEKTIFISDIKLVFNLSVFLLGQIILSIIFFITNFLEIQKLNFDIVERTNK